MTALHWAAERGNAELAGAAARRRRQSGARRRGIGRYTPLHVAAKGGHHRRRARAARRQGRRQRDDHDRRRAAALRRRGRQRRDDRRCCSTRGADVNAREPQWGQTPLMFAAAAGPHRRGARRCWPRGADLRAHRQRSSTSARAIARTAPRAARATRGSRPFRRSCAARARTGRRGARPRRAAAARGARRRRRRATSRSRSATPTWSGAHGGLTALLLAARDGHAETALALLDGRRRHQPGERRRIAPARC